MKTIFLAKKTQSIRQKLTLIEIDASYRNVRIIMEWEKRNTILVYA
jgi:hypothetical protein